MVNSWKKKDPPPNCVKLIPIQVIRTIQFMAGNSKNPTLQRTTNMIVLAFFFYYALVNIQHHPAIPNPSTFKAFNSSLVAAISTSPPPLTHSFAVLCLLP